MVEKVSTVFILGAGFSKGYNPDFVPLIHEFLDIAEKKGVLKPGGEHKELVDFIKKYFGDYRHVNIETLASFLTTDLVPDVFQKYEYREKLYKQLVLIIVNTLYQLYFNPVNEEVRTVFKKFANILIKERIDVITYNYDLILDNFLMSTDKWTIISGYGIEMKPALPSGIFKKENYQTDSDIYYLKLHGSLNWGRRIVPDPYRGDEIIVSPFGLKLLPTEPRLYIGLPRPENEIPILPIESLSSGEAHGVNRYYETFIIPPILSKERFYTTPLLQNIWYNAKSMLMRAKEIIIIGYSFPPSDFLAEFLFRQSMSNPFSKKEKKIRIINKRIDESYKNRVEDIFQKATFEYREEDVVAFLKKYTEE